MNKNRQYMTFALLILIAVFSIANVHFNAVSAVQDQGIVDPENPDRVVDNRDSNKKVKKLDPRLISDPVGPEDLSYRGNRHSDGTRSGEQDRTINISQSDDQDNSNKDVPKPVNKNNIEDVFPGKSWAIKDPADVGVRLSNLNEMRMKLPRSSCGVVVKNGYLIYQWGEQIHGEWGSATKPLYVTLLGFAIQEGKVSGTNTPLKSLGWELTPSDSTMTFSHVANMMSGYSLPENPGDQWAYNDYGIALFTRSLFDKVYQVNSADSGAITNLITQSHRLGKLQFQDGYLLIPVKSYPRIYMTPRDFARLGLFWMHKGRWKNEQLLSKTYMDEVLRPHAVSAVSRTIESKPNDYLNVGTYGSDINKKISVQPEQYGYTWWFNSGNRLWQNVPEDAFQANGHFGKEVMTIIPSLKMIVAWRGGRIRTHRSRMNKILGQLVESASGTIPKLAHDPEPKPSPKSRTASNDLNNHEDQ